MVITKTPLRMSFFGGGTDIPDFFCLNKGAVISTTIDKYVYVTAKELEEFFEYKNELVYSKLERVKDVEEIKHPMIKNAMKFLNMDKLRITYEADLPARSGLGSSSSFSVGLINALHRLQGNVVSKKTLADEAIYVERELCKEDGGWQDQIAASFGGLNRIDFENNEYRVTPLKISETRKEELNGKLLLFFTGLTRFSADIQKTVKKEMKDKIDLLKKMYSLVNEAQDILEDESRELDEFGKLLDITWRLKREVGSEISTNSIDELYEKGIKAGALGGKLLGAGGGGFLLFYVPFENQNAVRKALGLSEIAFKFEDGGSQFVYISSEVKFNG